MSTTIGGLLQLIATGIQDKPIINNPEITFFKKVFKKPTNFSICGIEKNLGLLKAQRENTINIGDNGDLLYNLYFQIFIPKTIQTEINTVTNIYNNTTLIVKQFDINYSDIYCLIFYNSNNWYIIPYQILQNPTITYNKKIINSFPFPIASNTNAIYYEISNNNNQIIPISTNEKLDVSIPIYWAYNIIINNLEVEQYFKYINDTTVMNLGYDIDIVYKYCVNNFLDFSLYQTNTLNTNSLIILIILKLLYNNSDNNLIFTFWKKYNVYENNEINFIALITDNNYFPNEWKTNLDNIINIYFSSNKIYNQINDIFNRYYLLTSVNISNLYNNLSLENAKDIYIKLKVIFNRFYSILNNSNYTDQINFNNNYHAKIYSLTDYDLSKYNNDNFSLLLTNEYLKYNLLINNYDNLNNTDFTKNLTPIDLQNIFGLIAYDISNYSLADKSTLSFLVFWRNCVFIRLYNRFKNVFNLTENNSNLYDLNLNRRLTLYYSIFPQDMFYYDDFQNSFYEMFYKNSFLGNWIINSDKLIDSKSNVFNLILSNLQNNTNDITFNNNFLNLSLNTIIFYTINQINQNNYLGIILSNNQVYKDKLVLNYNNYYNNFNFEIILVVYNSQYICNNIILNKTNLIIDITEFNINFSINQQIKLIINYKINIPLITFYKDNINYPYFKNNNYSNDKNSLNLELIYPNTNTFINLGYHKYGLVYSNSNSITEMIYITTININNFYVIKINFPIIYQNSEYTHINIYRTKSNDTKFYLIDKISINSTEYLDNKIDNLLIKLFVPKLEKVNSENLYLTTIDKNKIILNLIYNSKSLLGIGTYMYGILSKDTGLIDNINTIYVSNNQNVIINNTNEVIYRTAVNGTIFYLLENVSSIDNIPDSSLSISNNINQTIGYFDYGITFLSDNLIETEIDNYSSIYTNNQYVKIDNLPINKNYSYRNIYRRDSITNTFYLLDTINNTETFYIDYFNKKPSKFFINKVNNIPYDIITNFIYSNNSIILNNESLSYNYLYYLIYKNNFQDYIKLYPLNKYMSFTEQPFKISLNNIESNSDWDIVVNDSYVINNLIYTTDNNGIYTINNFIISDFIISNSNNLYDSNNNLIIETGYYFINSEYYYNKINNSLVPYTYIYLDIDIINLTSLNVVGNYGIYQNNLYQFLNGSWQIVVSGNFHNLIDNSYYTINIQNSLINYNINFDIITANLVTIIDDTINLSGYIINNSKLYEYINGSWNIVSNSIYYLISDTNFNNHFIQIDNNGNISIYNQITINYYNSFITSASGTYASINNKLYINNNGIWYLVTDNFFYDKTTTNRIYIDKNGVINIIKPIIVDGTIYSQSNGNLLKNNSIVTEGYFIINNIIQYINIQSSLVKEIITFIKPINYSISNNNLYIDNILQESGNFYINDNYFSINIINSITKIKILAYNYKFDSNKLFIYKPLLLGNYNYKISFYNKSTNEESYLSNNLNINNINGFNIILSQLSPIYNKNYNSWNIYRTVNNGTDYYKIANILDTIYNAENIFTDSFKDIDIIKLQSYQNIYNLTDNLKDAINNYTILKIPINNIAPNLYSFISHSSDVDFLNNKQILDCYDYIFNKPFLMFVRTNNNNFNDIFTLNECFTDNLLYFYNIPFLINSTTKIKLDNYNVNYIIPISTQQFFIRDTPLYTTEDYFSTNIIRQVLDNEISQNTFNPAYDSFNGNNNDLINIIDTLNNYNSIIDIINQTNNNYLNIFSYIKSQNIYGNTTLNYIFNNINNLFNYTNYDYENSSHYALFPFIYNTYNSGNKITSDISTYLQNISLYFQSYINNYYTSNNPNIITNIILLHPIIDNNIFQIKINNTVYTNPIIENNTILMNYSIDIPKENYVEKITNEIEKFKYIGIINLDTVDYKYNTYKKYGNNIKKIYNGNLIINSSNQINLNKINKYYYKIIINNNDSNINLLIDNKLYNLTKVSNVDNTYEIYSDTALNLIVNSFYVNTDLSFSNINNIQIINIIYNLNFNYYTSDDLSNYNYYSYDNIIFYPLLFNGFMINSGSLEETISIIVANFSEIYYLCNDNIIYKEIKECLNPYLITLINSKQLSINKKINIYYKILLNTISNNIIINVNYNPISFTLVNNYLEFYIENLEPFNIYVNNILYYDYTIIDFKEYNYYSEIINLNFSHYTLDSNIYYQITDINSQYFIINSELDNLNINICNFDYNSKIIKPTLNNIIDKLFIEDPNNYILCSDLNNNIDIFRIKNISDSNLQKNINYNCWIYKGELNIISQNFVPEYSFFHINNKFYYYDPNNSNLNTIISNESTFNILDNNMFDNSQKQLLKIKYNINCQEGSNYIQLNNDLNTINDQLFYKKSDNTIRNIKFNKNNKLFLNIEKEYIDYSNPIFPKIITSDITYSNLILPNINGSSYVIINNNSYYIGSLTDNYGIYESTSSNMIINGNDVYIKSYDKIITLWKINVITSINKFYIYIWTINTQINITIPTISQPYYLNNTNNFQSILGYKYYTNNRHIDNTFNYEILTLNYNSVFNLTNIYVNNKITLVHKYDEYYYIVKYDKLYLEMGEIIILDENKFEVLGLNIFTNYYEMKIIVKANKLLYNYTGYYSNKKYNNLKIEAKTNDIYKFYKNICLDVGYSYIDNSIFKINLTNQTINNIFVNINSPIHIKLFYSNEKFYLFDDFINLKIGDNLIYNNEIYNIIYIKDNQIIINSSINLVENNFYNFILCYLSIPNKEYCFTDNSFKINKSMNLKNINITNNYSLEIDISFNDINSVSTLIDLEVLNLYYYQPVYINGLYNYVVNCNNNIIYLLNPLLTNNCSTMILSPSNDNRYFIDKNEIYYNKKLYISNNCDTINYMTYNLNNNSWLRKQSLSDITLSNSDIVNFYKYKEYNVDYNLNIGSYHLLINSENIINFVIIIDQNKINFNIEGIYYLDKIFKCYVDSNGYFKIDNIKIDQLKKTYSTNKNKVEIIKKYDIKILGYDNNKYKISFINDYVNINIYNKIYINDIDYDFIQLNDEYYIITNTILDDFSIIITKNINWIEQTIDYSNYSKYVLGTQPNNSIYNINGKNYKIIPSNLNISVVYINNNYSNTDYYIENIDLLYINNNTYSITNNLILDNSEKYYIYDLFHSITNIVNGSIITLSYQLESNIKKTNLYLLNKNEIEKNNFIYVSYLDKYNIKFTGLKPWKNWTLLTYNYNLLNIGLQLDNLNIKQFNNNNYYLTINEINYLSYFLLNNKNYERIKLLEELLRNVIYNNWIKNPFFFKDVIKNINNFLNSNGYLDFYFNGKKLLYSDKTEIIYITDEFTYLSNQIYRDQNSYNRVINQINEYINTGSINDDIFFGISIHDLLNYLTTIESPENLSKNIQYSYTANYNDVSSYNLIVDTLYNSSTDINNINILPSLVNFTSSYLYDNFFILKQVINYSIINFTNLGFEYNLSFKSNEIYYNGNQLMKINNNYIINLPFTIESTIYFNNFTTTILNNELWLVPKNNQTLSIINKNKLYIDFGVEIKYIKFKTLINIYSNNYFLEMDSNGYYINYTLNENLTSFSLININYDLIDTNSFFEVIEKYNITLLEYQPARQYFNGITSNYSIEILGIEYNLIENYIEINNQPHDSFKLIDKIILSRGNYLDTKQYIIFREDFIYNENMLIKIVNINYILFKDDIGYYINTELSNIKFNGNINLLEYFNKIQYLDIKDLNFSNQTYITFNILEDENIITQQYLLNMSKDGRYFIETNTSLLNLGVINNVIITNNSNIYYAYLKYDPPTWISYSDFINARQYININNYFQSNSYISFTHNNLESWYKIYEESESNKYYIETSEKIVNNIIKTNIKQIVNSNYVNFCNNIVYKIEVEEDTTNNLIFQYDYIINNIIPNKIVIYDKNTLLIYHDSFINSINNLTYFYRLNHNFINKILNINGKIINIEDDYQYSINDSLYIFSKNVNKYFFELKRDINDNSDDDMRNNKITIYNEFVSNGLIYLNTGTNYIISLSEKINNCSNIKYKIGNEIFTSPNLIFKQNTLVQVSLNSQNFFNEISINENIYYGDYLVSYNNFNILNNSNNGKFVETIIPSTITNNIIEKTINNKIVPKYDKLFEYIKLYFNDQLIDELNEYIFNINYNLYATDEMKRNIEKLTLLRQCDNGYQLIIPINFWFSNNSRFSLPLISMPYTDIRLIYKSALSYDMEIKLLTEFIILDNEERKLFGSLKYEYIIQTYNTLPSIAINSPNMVINRHFSGLIKDIYLITDPFIKIINNYDSRLSIYVNAYNLWLSNNNDSNIDTIIINNNENEYKSWEFSINKSSFNRINNLVSNFNNLINNFQYNLIKFLMFFQDKFLSSNLLTDERKNYIIFIYLKYQFKNEQLMNNLPRINSLIFHGNGTELFSERDFMYFNYVIPYTKFKNTLPNNYYVYTFSLNPCDYDQFTGHQNYSNLDDSSITISSVNDIFTSYNLQIIVKQYNVLKIISGIGNLLFQ